MAELGLTYATLARKVSILAHKQISFSYVGYIINGRKRAVHWWPHLATALEAPLEYLTSPHPRAVVLHRDECNCGPGGNVGAGHA